MGKYLVRRIMTDVIEVEATSAEEAERIACETDSADFEVANTEWEVEWII